MEKARDFPLFTLGMVALPSELVPLHVFEDRYRQMMRDCTRGSERFGVVLIERGTEVGGGDTRFSVATVAHIAEAAELPDGRWALVGVGTRRVRVATWLPDDPYPVALVEDLPERPVPDAGLDALAEAERAVRRALALVAELDEPAPPANVPVAGDPTVAAYQLAAIAPLGPVDHQRLLELEDPVARLRLLAEMASDAAAVLAYRLSGG